MNISELLTGKGWFVITADVAGRAPVLNDHAYTCLERQLDRLPFAFVPVTGVYRGEAAERGFLVFGDANTARALCVAYDQESVLTPDGLVNANGWVIAPAVPSETVFGPAAAQRDYYTILPGGPEWSMGLDTSRM